MADKLLLRYREEERFPESVGISIWSSDAFKSDGELLCQILALMGARPVWDGQGRVLKTLPMDPAGLVLALPDGSRRPRPRVEVTFMKESSAEYDVLDCGCCAVSQGGMATAAMAVGGRKPKPLLDAVVHTYILDEENRAWLRKENSYALEEITRRLLEAAIAFHAELLSKQMA